MHTYYFEELHTACGPESSQLQCPEEPFKIHNNECCTVESSRHTKMPNKPAAPQSRLHHHSVESKDGGW